MVPVNWIAIVIATVAAMVVGWLWYGPVLGTAWRRLAGDPTPRAAVAYPLAFVANFVTAFVLAYVTTLAFHEFGDPLILRALLTGLFLWLGFTVARICFTAAFENRSIRLFAIHIGHDLVVTVIAAVIIGVAGI